MTIVPLTTLQYALQLPLRESLEASRHLAVAASYRSLPLLRYRLAEVAYRALPITLPAALTSQAVKRKA